MWKLRRAPRGECSARRWFSSCARALSTVLWLFGGGEHETAREFFAVDSAERSQVARPLPLECREQLRVLSNTGPNQVDGPWSQVASHIASDLRDGDQRVI